MPKSHKIPIADLSIFLVQMEVFFFSFLLSIWDTKFLSSKSLMLWGVVEKYPRSEWRDTHKSTVDEFVDSSLHPICFKRFLGRYSDFPFSLKTNTF